MVALPRGPASAPAVVRRRGSVRGQALCSDRCLSPRTVPDSGVPIRPALGGSRGRHIRRTRAVLLDGAPPGLRRAVVLVWPERRRPRSPAHRADPAQCHGSFHPPGARRVTGQQHLAQLLEGRRLLPVTQASSAGHADREISGSAHPAEARIEHGHARLSGTAAEVLRCHKATKTIHGAATTTIISNRDRQCVRALKGL